MSRHAKGSLFSQQSTTEACKRGRPVHAAMWMNLEDSMLSERSQSDTQVTCEISRKGKPTNRKQVSGYLGPE